MNRFLFLVIFFSHGCVAARGPALCFDLKDGAQANILSMFYTLLYALDQYDIGDISGISFDFLRTKHIKRSNDNWWLHFAKQDQWGEVNPFCRRICANIARAMRLRADFDMSYIRLHELLMKYIVLQDDIVKNVDRFAHKHFTKRKIIGAYYRKWPAQYQQASIGQFIDALHEHLDTYRHTRFFLVTEGLAPDDVLLKKLKKKYGRKIMLYPIVANPDAIDQNKKILQATMLLSKCNVLIKNSGTIGDMVPVFNPKLPIIALGHHWMEDE